MTITPDQARNLLYGATPAPWTLDQQDPDEPPMVMAMREKNGLLIGTYITEGVELDSDARLIAAARVILATVDAPTPTLAEAIEAWAEKHYSGVVGTGKHELLALADRAEQIEEERDHHEKVSAINAHQIGEVTRLLSEATCGQAGETAAVAVKRLIEARDILVTEAECAREAYAGRSEALKKVHQEHADALALARCLTAERDEARAEVERLTAENENLRRTDNYQEFKAFLGVKKGAESNAESSNPADVKEEEPYHIYYGVYGNDHTIGVRIDGKWRCIGDDRGVHVTDTNIASLTRLVPAPRVITTRAELDALPDDTIIRDTDGEVGFKGGGERWYIPSVVGPDTAGAFTLPATVLWTPEVTA